MGERVCPNCGAWNGSQIICKTCGAETEETFCSTDAWIKLASNTGPEKTNRFLAWHYGGEEVKKKLSQKYTQEELEQIYICPRCGDLGSMKDSNHCFYCGAQMVPTHYKYEDILQRDMSKEEFEQWKKTLYGEYCYPNPLFDKEEFHRTKIRKGEEEDPAKKQEEQMEQLLDTIRREGSSTRNMQSFLDIWKIE